MHNFVFFIILWIVILNFLLDRLLDWLNYKNWGDSLPSELEDIYDKEEYTKSKAYHKANHHFGWITSFFGLFLILGMLLLNGFALIDTWSRSLVSIPVFLPLVFFGILLLASDLLNTPFSIYDTFVIEQKFGFNTTTPKTFTLDKVKGWFLALILGGPILIVITWFYLKTGAQFWLWSWLLVTIFTLFITMFYSNLIVPLFNKQTPLEEGELRTAIEEMAKKAGFQLKNIFVIDGSKRSKKSNAYFTGLGPKKRIVLYDTLIQQLSVEEIVAVLAHEIGHYKKKHTLTGLFLSTIETGITLFILSIFIQNPLLSEALGGKEPSFHLALVAFGILYEPISMVTGLAGNLLSRRHEYQADHYAKEMYNGEALISALKKLSNKNFSHLTPHPLYVFFHYSHPTLLQRIRAIRRN